MRMRFCVTMFSAFVVAAAAHAAPPADQGFWTFAKEGMKDDLTLIALGMNAGSRVLIPGYAEFEDLATGEWDAGTLAEGAGSVSEAAAGQLKDIVKDPDHPLYQSARQMRKGNPWLSRFKSRNLTKSSKRLFKVAGALKGLTVGFDAFSEIRDATILAMEYQNAREAEYERTHRRQARDSRPAQGNRTPPEPLREPEVRERGSGGTGKKPGAAPPPASRSAFRLRRVPPGEADLVMRMDEGDAVVTPNSNFSFGRIQYRLLNRTKHHLAQCIVFVAHSAGCGQNVVFTDIPPGESRPSEEPFMLVGESVASDLEGEPFLFPSLMLVMTPDGDVEDLYDAPIVPSIGYQP